MDSHMRTCAGTLMVLGSLLFVGACTPVNYNYGYPGYGPPPPTYVNGSVIRGVSYPAYGYPVNNYGYGYVQPAYINTGVGVYGVGYPGYGYGYRGPNIVLAPSWSHTSVHAPYNSYHNGYYNHGYYNRGYYNHGNFHPNNYHGNFHPPLRR